MRAFGVRFFRFLPLVVAGLLANGCGDSSTEPSGDGNDGGGDPPPTTFSLFLTDAPGDVSRVWLEITSVTLVGGGPPVTVLSESTGLIEVTSLVDDALSLVQDLEIQPNGFSQLRLVIGGAVLETDDGEVFTKDGAEHPEGLDRTGDLQCPSCSQSGLKVKLSGEVTVTEGEDAGVLMDFDVGQSFGRQRGNSGRWVMSPVIHAGEVDPDEVESGNDGRVEVTGTVTLADGVAIPACPAGEDRSLEDFIPVAIATTLTDDEGNPVTISGEANDDGTFELKVLEPDTYELGFVESIELDEGGPLTWAATAEPAQITVTEGGSDISGVAYTITEVSCESGGDPPPASTVSVYITDAPGDVARFWAEITKITFSGGAPQVTVLEESTGLIEITALTGDEIMTLVDDLEIDAGSFKQVKIVIGEAVLETDDGQVFSKDDAVHPGGLETTGELQCPSCSQSGIKIKLSGDLEIGEGEEAGLLMDFDVSQSLGRASGNSNRWVMRPVINGNKLSDDELDEGGGDPRVEILGEVALADGVEIPACPAGEDRTLEDFIPVAIATTLADDEGEPLSFSGETNDDGTFELKVLDPDTYQMGFIESVDLSEGGPLTWTATVEPAQVTVNEGDEEVTGVAYTITAVSCDSGGAPAPASVSLYITDAPGDVARFWAEITKITFSGGAPQVTVLDESTGLIEITALTGGEIMTLVNGLEIDAAEYKQVKVVIGEAVLETDDGQVFAKDNTEHPEGLETTGRLQCPSCSQSGIKIKLSGDLSLAEGEEAGLLMDFDVSQSLGRGAGNSNRWVMRPVINGSKLEGDDGDGGTDPRLEILGEVVLADGVEIPACPAGEERSLEDFVPVATATTLTDDEGQPLTFSGETNEDGTFELKVLDPDTYDLSFLDVLDVGGSSELSFAASVEPASATLEEGDEEIGGFVYTITSATCTASGG